MASNLTQTEYANAIRVLRTWSADEVTQIRLLPLEERRTIILLASILDATPVADE